MTVFSQRWSLNSTNIQRGVNERRRVPSFRTCRMSGYRLFTTKYIKRVERSTNTFLPFRVSSIKSTHLRLQGFYGWRFCTFFLYRCLYTRNSYPSTLSTWLYVNHLYKTSSINKRWLATNQNFYRTEVHWLVRYTWL